MLLNYLVKSKRSKIAQVVQKLQLNLNNMLQFHTGYNVVGSTSY